MDLRQLEVFEAIMRSGSVSAAARELGLTQSAVSRILARFEAQLGALLFARVNCRLSPTRHANGALPQARGILEAVSALQAMSYNAGSKRRDLTFVTVQSLSYELIQAVLRDFLKACPDVRFGFDVRTTEATVDAMVRSEAEFALVALPVSHPTLTATPLLRTSSCVVMPKGHRLAALSKIGPQDLARERMIFLLRRQPTRQLIEDAFHRACLQPEICVETSNVATACRCASEGLGVAVVNAMMAGYSATPNLAIRPFEPRIHHTIALIEQAGRERSPELSLFIDCLTAEVRQKFASLALPLDILKPNHSGTEYLGS